MQDRGAQRAHRVVDVEENLFGIRGRVADGVDVGLRGAQRGGIGFHARVGGGWGGEPGLGQPGGVGLGTRSVDVDVYGFGGVVGQGYDCFIAGGV